MRAAPGEYVGAGGTTQRGGAQEVVEGHSLGRDKVVEVGHVPAKSKHMHAYIEQVCACACSGRGSRRGGGDCVEWVNAYTCS